MAFLFIESSPETGSTSLLQNAAQAVKVLLLLAGVVSTALMVRGAFMSFSCEIVFSNLVGFWASVACVLSSPLYICIIINSIVLLIAASSAFHSPPPPAEKSSTSDLGSGHDHDHDRIPSDFDLYDHRLSAVPPPEKRSATALCKGSGHDHDLDIDLILSNFDHIGSYDHHPPTVPPPPEKISAAALYKSSGHVIPSTFPQHHTPVLMPPSPEKISNDRDHDLIPSTFHHRETYDQHPPTPPPPATKETEAEEMTVTDHMDERSETNKYEEEETMEATWEAIAGARTKQLQKSETFTEEMAPAAATPAWKDLRKSETFNESVSKRRVGGLMRDPSLGIDEFNEQVEAFIKKFNANMRLQRQESDQRFLDMNINNRSL